MTREEIKELLPIMQAWAEGKAIQFRIKGTVEWIDYHEDDLRLSSLYHYRIKPEPKYRPFETKEECWEEMHKHPDFGWVVSNGVFFNIQSVCLKGIDTTEHLKITDYEDAVKDLTFTDGMPFGIKEE